MGLIFKLMKFGWVAFKFVAITTVLTQFVLLSAMFGKGYLTQKKLNTLRAIYAGVDYEEIRKQEILNKITKDRDPFQVSKTQLVSARRTAIGQHAGDVSLTEIQLKSSGQRFSEVEINFDSQIAKLEKDIYASTQKELQRLFSNMSVVQKKDTVVNLIKDGGIDHAVFLVKGLNGGAQKKLFGEMKTDEEKNALGQILRKVRNVTAAEGGGN